MADDGEQAQDANSEETFKTFESFPFPFELKPTDNAPRLSGVDSSDNTGLQNGWLITTVNGKDVRGLSAAAVIKTLADSPKFPMKLGFSPEKNQPGIHHEELGRNCLLLRNALTMQEQTQLVECLQEQKRAFELEMGGGFDCGDLVSFDMSSKEMQDFDTSIPGKALLKAKQYIATNYKLQGLKDTSELNPYCVDGRYYGESQILECHYDRIKQPHSVVFLYSLGRTANFYVHCSEMEGDKDLDGKLFEFNSGDLLFFDATVDGQVYHGIKSIGSASSCPDGLKDHLGEKRVGLQIRAN